MDTPRRRSSRIWFVIISISLLISALIASVVTAAAALEDGRDQLFSYIPNPYNKLLGAKENIAAQMHTVKNQVIEIQTSDQLGKSSFHANGEAMDRGRSLVSSDGTVSWVLNDSKGKEYRLTVAEEDYLKNMEDVTKPIQYLETKNGSILAVNDYSKYVHSNDKFSELADEMYRNAGSDYQFVYEVWYLVTHSTQYAPDETEEVRQPFATLFTGKGDCEDLTILMASILVSSSYTKDWDIKLVYFDAFNPDEPNSVNHVALFIQTDQFSTFVESTNSELNGLGVWQKVDGWYVGVSTNTL
jgi:hypothetical protein